MSDKAKLLKCPACGREVSVNAANCPGCGEPIAETRRNDKAIGRGIVAVLIVVVTIWIVYDAVHNMNNASREADQAGKVFEQPIK